MPWARFDDRFPSNRKIRKLSDRAFRLYVSAICWSAENLTDGFIPEGDLRLVADVRGPKTVAAELVAAGLWDRHEPVPDAFASPSEPTRDEFASPSSRVRDEVASSSCNKSEAGWLIHDYLDYNFSADQARKERAEKAARQKRWREKKKGGKPTPEPPGGKPDVDASTDASRDASRDAAPRARVPDPTRPAPKDVVDVGGDSAGSRAPTPERPDGLAPIDIDGFQLTDGMRRWAQRDGYATLIDIDHATAQFVSHYRSTGARRKSWPDAWQKWIRDDAKKAADRASRPTQGAFLVPLPGGGQTTPPAARPSTTDQRITAAREAGRRVQARMDALRQQESS